MVFKDAFWKEWERLNPRFVATNEGVRGTIKQAFQDSLSGYFAPLRMAGWLINTVLKKVI